MSLCSSLVLVFCLLLGGYATLAGLIEHLQVVPLGIALFLVFGIAFLLSVYLVFVSIYTLSRLYPAFLLSSSIPSSKSISCLCPDLFWFCYPVLLVVHNLVFCLYPCPFGLHIYGLSCFKCKIQRQILYHRYCNKTEHRIICTTRRRDIVLSREDCDENIRRHQL